MKKRREREKKNLGNYFFPKKGIKRPKDASNTKHKIRVKAPDHLYQLAIVMYILY